MYFEEGCTTTEVSKRVLIVILQLSASDHWDM